MATRQIQTLLKMGMNQADLEDAILLLGQVGWTTKGVEEQHGSLAHVHRAHPDIDASNLALRSYIHACRVLWRPDRSASRIGRLQKLLHKTRERRGRHISGENMFFKELHGRVRSRLTGSGTRSGVQQHILKQSRTRWHQLSDQQKHRYRLLARQATQTKLSNNKADEDAFRTQLQLATADVELEQRERRGLNALSSCRFSENSKLLLIDHHGRSALTQGTLQHFADRLEVPPAALSQSEVQGLEPHLPDHGLPEVPGWGRLLCYHRDLFKDCVIRLRRQRNEQAWLFLCGLQKPYVAHWLPLLPRQKSGLETDRSSSGHPAIPLDDAKPVWIHHWSFTSPTCYAVDWSELPGDDAVDALEVIPNACFFGNYEVVSDSDATPWTIFTQSLPSKSYTRPQPRKPKASDDLLMAHPWLSEILGTHSSAASSTGHSSDGSGDEGHDVHGEQHTDEAIEAAWQELQDKRSLLPEDTSPDTAHFVISIRGGAYTYKKAGVAADCVVCAARGSSAKAFCRDFQLQLMYSFAFKKYTEAAALRMATEVCKRLDFWHSLHLEFTEDCCEFTDELLNSYAGNETFAAWRADLPQGSPAALRATAIETMRPVRGT